MPQGGGTTRWCPTPEQLMMLEEMYRGGLRTPSAAQIQQITAHLACYGRIEGKNVFYWFQNHKARDRQKLRRRLCMTHHLLSCAQYYNQHYLLGHAHAHAAAAAAPQYCLDQALVSSPALAAAAPYYYPFRAAATSPTSSLFQYQGGGVVPDYSLGKLDNFGVAVDEAATLTASTTDAAAPPGYETDAVQAVSLQPPHEPSPCCRPLRTLELFPTSSASVVKDADDDQLGPTSK